MLMRKSHWLFCVRMFWEMVRQVLAEEAGCAEAGCPPVLAIS